MAQLCSIVLTGCQCGPRVRLFLSVGWPVLSPAPPYSSVAGGLCCLCSGTITIWPLPWATTPDRARRGIVPRPPWHLLRAPWHRPRVRHGISCVRYGVVPRVPFGILFWYLTKARAISCLADAQSFMAKR